jgi:ligand-binding sensor domain-containing protein
MASLRIQTVKFGSQRNGLNRLDPERGIFNHYQHDPNDSGSLDANSPMQDIRFVGVDKTGMLWVQTSAGINSFDQRSGQATRYPQLRNRDEYQVQRVYQDRSGRHWFIHGKAVALELLTRDRRIGPIYV